MVAIIIANYMMQEFIVRWSYRYYGKWVIFTFKKYGLINSLSVYPVNTQIKEMNLFIFLKENHSFQKKFRVILCLEAMLLEIGT